MNKGAFIYKPIQIPLAKGFNLVCENLDLDSQAGVSRLYYFNEEKKKPALNEPHKVQIISDYHIIKCIQMTFNTNLYNPIIIPWSS